MKNRLSRILLSLIGTTLILWGITTLALGVFGERDMAVITSVRRQGGERNDGKPGRYTYSIGYIFTLPDGRQIDGSDTRIGSSVYLKADGTTKISVRYCKAVPYINTPEENTRISLGQPTLIAAGMFLIVIMNRKNQAN